MGYTHYWKFNGTFTDEVLKDVRIVVRQYKDILRLGCDSEKRPSVSKKRIRFNGIGSYGYETFRVEPNTEHFCKTRENAYDIAVCEVLLVLKHHYGDKFELDSDGFSASSKEDMQSQKLRGYWNEALINVSNRFDYTFVLIPENDSSWEHYHFRIVSSEESLDVTHDINQKYLLVSQH
ncbi:hypothetical protein [Aneurinibacillus tyrosinisolvens]|uniref:hypothetical protein n=1 Tax=Aneurinibacillus tyrosinisolvens TaxID=1443435 RepID=UPI00063F3FCC|nr:hypothetical protein [Aneurinibacillus tyrosinisolvens]